MLKTMSCYGLVELRVRRRGTVSWRTPCEEVRLDVSLTSSPGEVRAPVGIELLGAWRSIESLQPSFDHGWVGRPDGPGRPLLPSVRRK